MSTTSRLVLRPQNCRRASYMYRRAASSSASMLTATRSKPTTCSACRPTRSSTRALCRGRHTTGRSASSTECACKLFERACANAGVDGVSGGGNASTSYLSVLAASAALAVAATAASAAVADTGGVGGAGCGGDNGSGGTVGIERRQQLDRSSSSHHLPCPIPETFSVLAPTACAFPLQPLTLISPPPDILQSLLVPLRAPALCDPEIRIQRSKRAPAKNLLSGRSGGARNVMLHRMRSMRARDLSEKYRVDWKNVLGEGAYGSVHPARLAATGEKVALKKMKKRYTNTSSFRTETDALLRIYDNGGHPNVAALRDLYEDYSDFYLVMDLVSGGEMFEHLINYGAYSEADAARLMQEIASALAFLHGVGVIHADLKPENILLCSKKKSDGTIKIIDFGCAVVSHDNYFDDYSIDDDDEDMYDWLDGDDMGSGNNSSGLKSAKKTTGGGGTHTITVSTAKVASVGTTAYWSPERFLRGPEGERLVPDTPCDLWSLGVILYIMLTGTHPFDITGMSTDAEIEERIRTDPSPPITPELTGHLSPSAVDLITKLMEPDPEKRITSREMLSHPWVCGEAAATTKMADSAIKLARFKDLRNKVETGIFAVLVDRGNRDATLSEAKVSPVEEEEDGGQVGNGGGEGGRGGNASSTHIMKRAFEVFDVEGKGFVSPDDLGRIVRVATGKSLSTDEQRDMLAAAAAASSTGKGATSNGLSLSDFSELFGRLKHKHFPRGHVIFRAGDPGGAMYFINSGKVEIQTRKGQLVAILRHHDFFGEGSMLDEKNVRFTTAKASTPVDVIKISKDEFDRYIASSSEAKHTLKRKWRARLLKYAKNLIRLQTNVKERTFKKGDVIYKEGDVGKSMFLVNGGRLAVKHGDVSVHEYFSGDSFGESSLVFERPRSSTVICASDTCNLHEMLGSDFLSVLESSPDAAASLRDMCRKRLFKKAVKTFSLGKKRGLTNDDIVAAFYEADTDNSGQLSFDEIKNLIHKMDPTIPEQEIRSLIKFIDIDEDGLISLEEFKRLFRSFEYEEQRRKY
mmetsp:Transcript_3184/g.6953  ORF Transcript_3184/g.6953 Transcript_3184/m.6953 type:complete len:1032 (+) Transcript_3184:126-3221(+)